MTFQEPEHHAAASRYDFTLIITGVLIFIASFLPWYGAEFAGELAEAGVTGTYNAWHDLTAIGLLLVLFSLVVGAAEPFFGEDVPTFALAVVSAVLSSAGAALVVMRSFALPDPDIPGVSTSLRWGGWILVVLVIVHAVISVVRAVKSRRAE